MINDLIVELSAIIAICVILLIMLWYTIKNKKISQGIMLISLSFGIIMISNLIPEVKAQHKEIKFQQERKLFYEDNYEKMLKEIIDINKDHEYGKDFVFKGIKDFTIENMTKIDVLIIGEQDFEVSFIDELDYPVKFNYKQNIVDTNKPEIENVKDIEVKYGGKFTVDDLKITATDPIDGELKVKFAGDGKVDSKKPGKYIVEVSAVDKNGNIANDEFTVTVGPKPIPKVEPEPKPKAQVKKQASVSQANNSTTAKPEAQGVQTIKFANSKIVPYYNGGSAKGQGIIDKNHNVASTWSMNQYVVTHSNADGSPTYFAGHDNAAFSHLKYIKIGEIISIKDHTGNVANYKVNNSYFVDNTPAGGGLYYPSDEGEAALHGFTGEGIMFQTCVNNNPARNLIITARP